MESERRLIDRKQVEEITGYSTRSIYRLMRKSIFPQAVRIGPRAIRWWLHEINEYLDTRPRTTGEQTGPQE